MRKLASIQKVLNVRPIDGADRIEVVDVLGWSVVVQKGEFKPGDPCVYFEVDAFLSANDPRYATFEERFSNWGEKRGMRLRTIKLRKQISQGLVLHPAQFTELPKGYAEGDDVTDILKIEKWEAIEDTGSPSGGMGAKTAGAAKFPAFIRKTDQERVQNYINELGKHTEETFEISIKLDGSSMTVFRVSKSSPQYEYCKLDLETRALRNMSWVGKQVYKLKKFFGYSIEAPEAFEGVCSRNIQLDLNGSNHFSEYVRKHDILGKMAMLAGNYAIQGELVAPSIQENYERVSDFEFYVFDIFDIDTQEYLKPRVVRAECEFAGLKTVPILETEATLVGVTGTTEPREMVDKILAHAEGPGMNPGVKREGEVWKSNQSDFSMKAISNSYLLKKDGAK